MAMAGATRETMDSSGRGSGQTIPTTPMAPKDIIMVFSTDLPRTIPP